ncbi:hypothetical protein PENSTE_c027G09831 [Penicillium steckii]|uniref:Uncharacterized protein n=1 Tax=Penicillium steckii TaxID=303698 RepID=A0A1V6SPQ3_9EURO|nr:hypothetical protein PENSTE_c027G09831 [Penicillium steckii]
MSPSAIGFFKAHFGHIPPKPSIRIELDSAHEDDHRPFMKGDTITGTVLLTYTQHLSIEDTQVVVELDEDAWASILLRIAKGTNMLTSLSMNNYTIGFSGLLQ